MLLDQYIVLLALWLICSATADLMLSQEQPEPLISGLPTSASRASNPSIYVSTTLSALPGYFIIEPRTSGIQALENIRLDLNFDRKHIVAIDPSLYSYSSDFAQIASKDQEQRLAWKVLKDKIVDMNKKADAGTQYKVVFLARHGQGYHNAAETFYGMYGWECYWAMVGTNGTHTWGPDAKLTPHGIAEAAQRGAAWKRQISLGAPIPQVHFVSPLSRSIRTMEETWKDVYGWNGGAGVSNAPTGVKPVVKELFRETIGLHYSDHRSSLQTIHAAFPYLVFSPQPFPQYGISPSAFPDMDPLWDFQRETMTIRDLRIKTALQDALLEAGEDLFVGITCHFGVIESALKVLGHKFVDVDTTGVVPVMVKITRGDHDPKASGWYGVYSKVLKKQVESRSVCDGFPEVKIQGGYEVPGGIGTDDE